MRRHYGVTETGSRVAVIFMQIPDDPNHCLTVDLYRHTENVVLDELIELIDSDEGQRNLKIYELLNRRRSQTGVDILTALHKAGMMTKQKTDNIYMTPDPSTKVRLSEINGNIRKIAEGSTHISDEQKQEERNAHLHNMQEVERGQIEQKIRNLLYDATELEAQADFFLKEAQKKRTQAESLKPAEVAAPVKRGRKPKNV